jgi:hypothetical protein
LIKLLEKKYFEIEIDWSKLSKIQQTRLQTITIDQMNMIKSVSFQKKKESREKSSTFLLVKSIHGRESAIA